MVCRAELAVLVDLEHLALLVSKDSLDHRDHLVPRVTRDQRDLQVLLAEMAMKVPPEPQELQVMLAPQDLVERRAGEERQDHRVFQAQLDQG